MITGLISAIVGLFSGVLPDVLKEFTAGRAQAREIEFLRVQNELALQRQNAAAEDKLRDAHNDALAAEFAALRENLQTVISVQATPTGNSWIDGFNALIRPFATVLVLCLFIATSAVFVRAVIIDFNVGAIKDSTQLANVIWGSMIGESAQAVLGFVFGYRSTVRR